MRLAKQGNRTVQLELALNYLRGTKGFSRSDSEFEHWVRLAARDGHFSFDATCYYVDFLVSRGRRVHHVLVRKLEAESVKRPRWKELTALLKKARARQCNAAPLTRI